MQIQSSIQKPLLVNRHGQFQTEMFLTHATQ